MEKKADLKTMKKSEVAGFIWDYYKWWIIGGVIVIALVTSLIYHFVTYKSPIVELVLVNCASEGEETEPDFSDFMDQYGYDDTKQEVVLQNSYAVNLTNGASGNVYSFEALQTLIAAGGVDVLAADKEVYAYLAKQQNVADLSDYLSADLMEKYAKNIVYVTDSETGKKYPAGIRLVHNQWMDNYGYYPDGCVIGIVNGSGRTTAAKQLMQYLLGED